MKTRFAKQLCGVGAAMLLASTVHAGSIVITGHDIEFHSNQNGYGAVILNWLRGAGTGSEIAQINYTVGVLRSNEIGGTFNNVAGYTIDTRDPSADFANAAAFAAWLSTIDVLEIASFSGCGGCDLTAADSAVINTYAPQIATYFNAGGDIWANSGDGLATYYNFLPPSAVATGAAISASTGFAATAAGTAIGITNSMVNGFPTHNSFNSLAPAFTIFEVYTPTGQAVTAGIRDATITGGGITVPEPGSLALLGLGLLGLLGMRRRRA